MINILKTDFYKAFRATSFWVTSTLVILFSLLESFLIFWGFKMTVDNAELLDLMGNYIPGFFQAVLGIISQNIFLSGIFACVFATSDFTHGTIKNIASKGYRREYIYASKFITTLGVTIIHFILCFLTSFITAQIVIGNKIPDFFKYSNYDIKNIFALSLQIIAYISLALLLAMLFRSTGPTIATFLGFIFLEGTFIELIDQFINHVLHQNFSISAYSISRAVADSYMLRGSIVILIYIVIFTLIGMYSFNKRDIN